MSYLCGLLPIFIFGLRVIYGSNNKFEFINYNKSNNSGFNISKRIAYGKPASPNDFPYLVRVNTIENGLICGGTMFSPKCVLTAAHCIENIFAKRVWIGDSTTSNKISGGEFFYWPVSYGRIWMDMDIAIIRLDENVNSPYVKIIDIDRNPVYMGESINIVGWGNTENGNMNKNLYKANVHRVRCRYGNLIQRTQNMFCLIGQNGEDACPGDSGGPALRGNKQVGVVSFGAGCGMKMPGFYTKLSSPNVQEFLNIVRPLC